MAARIVIAVVFGVLVLLGILSFYAQSTAADAEDEHEDTDAKDAGTAVGDARQASTEELTRVQYRGAVRALDGLPVRLRLFAESSQLLAQQCRRDATLARAPTRLTRADQVIPYELEYRAARPGHATDWQPLDRALKRLEAIYDQDDGAVHADAHERVSLAAAELAYRLDDTALPIDLDHCWFCERQITDVPRLLCGPHASICDECVCACHDRLEYEQ